jgi:hypothetical protein
LEWSNASEVWLENDVSSESVGQWLSNIGSGVATGVATGSVGGPIGAIVGGIVGGGLGALQTALGQNQQPKRPQSVPHPPAPRATHSASPMTPLPKTPGPVSPRPPLARQAMREPPLQPAPSRPPQKASNTGAHNDLTSQLSALVPAMASLIGQLNQILDERKTAVPSNSQEQSSEVLPEALVDSTEGAEPRVTEEAEDQGPRLEVGPSGFVEENASNEAGPSWDPSLTPSSDIDSFSDSNDEWLSPNDRADTWRVWTDVEEEPWTK